MCAVLQFSQSLQMVQHCDNAIEYKHLPQCIDVYTQPNFFLKSGQLGRGLRAMDRMRQQNLKPGVVPYTSLGMPCLCCRLYAHRSRACDYEVITYPHHPPSLPLKVDACCRIGDLETGFSLLRRMMWQDRVQPNAITCSALINGCGKKGEIDAALQVIMRTKKKPSYSSLCVVSSPHNSSTYTLLCFVQRSCDSCWIVA